MCENSFDVSVVIPVHNAARTINEAINSALSQKLIRVEVIVCDDGSNDGTLDKLKKFPDSAFKLIVNKTNIGPGPSRDSAIKIARGKWVAFLDADDAFVPGRLQRMLESTGSKQVDVIFDDLMLCHDTLKGLKPWRSIHGKRAFGAAGVQGREVRASDYVRSPRLLVKPLIRTEFIREHRVLHSARRFAEDAEFILRLVHSGAKLSYIPQPMYLYRITPGSLTAQAKSPVIMRRVIEECSLWPGWSEVMQKAFYYKVDSLKSNEKLYEIQDAVKSMKVLKVFKIILNSPSIVLDALKLIPFKFSYLGHRLLNKGRKR